MNNKKIWTLAATLSAFLFQTACSKTPKSTAIFNIDGTVRSAGKAVAETTGDICVEYSYEICSSVTTIVDKLDCYAIATNEIGSFKSNFSIEATTGGHCYSDTEFKNISLFVKLTDSEVIYENPFLLTNFCHSNGSKWGGSERNTCEVNEVLAFNDQPIRISKSTGDLEYFVLPVFPHLGLYGPRPNPKYQMVRRHKRKKKPNRRFTPRHRIQTNELAELPRLFASQREQIQDVLQSLNSSEDNLENLAGAQENLREIGLQYNWDEFLTPEGKRLLDKQLTKDHSSDSDTVDDPDQTQLAQAEGVKTWLELLKDQFPEGVPDELKKKALEALTHGENLQLSEDGFYAILPIELNEQTLELKFRKGEQPGEWVFEFF